MMKYWDKIQFFVLLILLALTALSSHPTITRMSREAGMANGTFLSVYVLAVFALLVLLCYRSLFRLKIQRKCWLLLFFILVAYLGTYVFFDSSTMLEDVRAIGICLCGIAIGVHLKMDEKKYRFLLLYFAGLITFVGLMQVLQGVGGFVIKDQYIRDNKNSLGVELSTAIIIYLILGISNKKKLFYKIVAFSLAILTFVILITIRARSSTLATLLIVMYFVYVTYKNNYKKNYALRIIGLLFVLGIVIVLLPETFGDYIYNSFYQNHEEDLSSGRFDRNRAAIQFLKRNPYFGNLMAQETLVWIHNYPLLKLFENGIFFSIPIVILYLYILVFTIRRSFVKNMTLRSVGYTVLIIPYMISLAEPTFPFGPGTATVMNYILFGVALRDSYIKKNKNEITTNI